MLQILLLSELILLIFHIVCGVMAYKETSWFGDPVCQNRNYTTVTFDISPNSSLAYNMVCVGYSPGIYTFLSLWKVLFVVLFLRLFFLSWFVLLTNGLFRSMRKHDTGISFCVSFCAVILVWLVYATGYLWEVFLATQVDLGVGAIVGYSYWVLSLIFIGAINPGLFSKEIQYDDKETTYDDNPYGV